MTKLIVKTLSTAQENRAYITKLLLGGCMLVALLYAYNMYVIVSHSVAAQSIEKQMAVLQNKVQALDTEYITLSNKITPDMAKKYGLQSGAVTVYIPRTQSLGSLPSSENKL